MTVYKIEAVAGGRNRIILDTGERFILYKGELRHLKLKENLSLSEDTYNQIMKGILVKRSKLRLMNLLKTKSYTEYQLRKKLADGEYPEEVIEQAISYVKSFKYVDDMAYAVEYIKSHYEKNSKKEIYQKLQLKGIDKHVLDGAFLETYGASESDNSIDRVDEHDIIVKTLKKRGFTGSESYEERQKILAYFYRRGFDIDAVYEAMDLLKEEL